MDREISQGLCGHIRTTVNVALCHYFIYGFFAVCFVYTNHCYPPFYYVDHMFGGSGAFLMGFTLVGSMFAHSNSCQPIRFIFGLIIPLNVLFLAVSTYYYTIERWYDVEVTAFVKSLRPPIKADFPDYFWYTLVVVSCINCFVFLIYIPYFISFMCHKRKLFLFMSYRRPVQSTPYTPFSLPTVQSNNSQPTNQTR